VWPSFPKAAYERVPGAELASAAASRAAGVASGANASGEPPSAAGFEEEEAHEVADHASHAAVAAKSDALDIATPAQAFVFMPSSNGASVAASSVLP